MAEINAETQTRKIEKIKYLRKEVVSKFPLAEKILKKSGKQKPYSKEDQRLKINISSQSVREQQNSETDSLTGLLNKDGYKRRLEEEISRAKAYNHALSVAVIDLNDLKKINDTQGHDAGDEYIKRLAECIKFTTRISDIVARPGGDEFNIILTETNIEGASVWKGRIENAFKENNVNASIGISEIDKEDYKNSLKKADENMYEEKRLYKQRQNNNH